MTSAGLFCVVKEHGVHDIRAVDLDQHEIYDELCCAISTKNLQKFLQLLESVTITYTLLNRPIFICDTECTYTDCIAINLCHFAVFNNCSEILDELLRHGGDLSQKIIEVTLSQSQRNFVEKDSLIDLIVRHFNDPVKYFQDLFDRYIESTDLGSSYELKFDFSILYPSARMEKDVLKRERQMCVLNEIVNSSYDVHSEECGLLQHPLIEAYLTFKWIHYRRFFYILVAIHALFVACLSTTAFLIVGNFNEFLGMQNQTLDSVHTDGSTLDVVLCSMKVLNCVLLLMGCLLFAHALIQTFFRPLRKLVFEFEVLSNLFTSLFSVLNCTYGIVLPMQWQLRHQLRLMYTVNSLIILPAWINLMLIIGRIPSLGCYGLMFTTVMKNFFKVMVSFIFLIIGFALSFSLVFPMSDNFNNPVAAILRTIVMMVGEFDFAETFSDNGTFLSGLSKFIFVLFIISCSIILMNLTQGIAVNDIKLLHEISQIIRLEKETRFLYEFEYIFTQQVMVSNPLLRKIKKRLYDSGAIKCEMTITNKNRQGISCFLLARLVQLYKPSKYVRNLTPPLSRNHFKCLPNNFAVQEYLNVSQ